MPIKFKDYAPTTLEEALDVLLQNITKEEKELVKETDPVEFHHSVGQAMRNAWLWNKEHPLHKHFVSTFKLGMADDMSGIILEALYHHLNNKTFDIHKKVKFYQDYWIEKGYNPQTLETLKVSPWKA